MKFPCTGVILAGGLNQRFSGREKALIRFGETRIIERIFAVLANLFEEIILVTNSPINYTEWDAMIATDIIPVRSALTGIHAGLFYASNDYAFICAGDTPFLNEAVIRILLSAMDPRWDVILPETSEGLEPLCAVYSKQMLSTIEGNLGKNRFKISQSFRKGRIKKIKESVLREKDPELLTFFNVNTPEDLDRALKIENESAK
ncbi:MAG TPA: molybdenum cofactor guanylyltransferase [Deltaproteobacteria bacterium]|nr:molybdenum cofactor guanylyltransferase [Deltaproteobacteria bacterium]